MVLKQFYAYHYEVLALVIEDFSRTSTTIFLPTISLYGRKHEIVHVKNNNAYLLAQILVLVSIDLRLVLWKVLSWLKQNHAATKISLKMSAHFVLNYCNWCPKQLPCKAFIRWHHVIKYNMFSEFANTHSYMLLTYKTIKATISSAMQWKVE